MWASCKAIFGQIEYVWKICIEIIEILAYVVFLFHPNKYEALKQQAREGNVLTFWRLCDYSSNFSSYYWMNRVYSAGQVFAVKSLRFCYDNLAGLEL